MPRAHLALATSLVERLEAHRTRGGVYHLPESVGAQALLGLASEVMRDDLAVYPHGEMLLWDIARHEGYVIPPYPLAGFGEAQQFLADYGAADVPGWYELRGIGPEVTRDFYAYGCVMSRNRSFWRRIWAVPVGDLSDANLLAAWLARAIAFSLGNATDTDDPFLFRC